MQLETDRGGGVYPDQAILEEQGFMALENLQVLEDRIDAVLARCAAAEADRERLRGELAQANHRIDELTARLESYEKERGQVRARVESILGRLEGLDLS